MKTKNIRHCENCGKDYIADCRDVKSRYCKQPECQEEKKRCKRARKRELAIAAGKQMAVNVRHCKFCGEDYAASPTDSLSYCCKQPECREKKRQQDNLRLRERQSAARPKYRICSECPVKFAIPPGRRGLRITCSPECAKKRNVRLESERKRVKKSPHKKAAKRPRRPCKMTEKTGRPHAKGCTGWIEKDCGNWWFSRTCYAALNKSNRDMDDFIYFE